MTGGIPFEAIASVEAALLAMGVDGHGVTLAHVQRPWSRFATGVQRPTTADPAACSTGAVVA